jgi:hypothetical protein
MSTTMPEKQLFNPQILYFWEMRISEAEILLLVYWVVKPGGRVSYKTMVGKTFLEGGVGGLGLKEDIA